MTGSIMLAAGGTGGHVFPAQVLAAELDRRGRGVDTVAVTIIRTVSLAKPFTA